LSVKTIVYVYVTDISVLLINNARLCPDETEYCQNVYEVERKIFSWTTVRQDCTTPSHGWRGGQSHVLDLWVFHKILVRRSAWNKNNLIYFITIVNGEVSETKPFYINRYFWKKVFPSTFIIIFNKDISEIKPLKWTFIIILSIEYLKQNHFNQFELPFIL
jgi:hypothetical protein